MRFLFVLVALALLSSYSYVQSATLICPSQVVQLNRNIFADDPQVYGSMNDEMDKEIGSSYELPENIVELHKNYMQIGNEKYQKVSENIYYKCAKFPNISDHLEPSGSLATIVATEKSSVYNIEFNTVMRMLSKEYGYIKITVDYSFLNCVLNPSKN